MLFLDLCLEKNFTRFFCFCHINIKFKLLLWSLDAYCFFFFEFSHIAFDLCHNFFLLLFFLKHLGVRIKKIILFSPICVFLEGAVVVLPQKRCSFYQRTVDQIHFFLLPHLLPEFHLFLDVFKRHSLMQHIPVFFLHPFYFLFISLGELGLNEKIFLRTIELSFQILQPFPHTLSAANTQNILYEHCFTYICFLFHQL